jgi:hypothetical protein
MNRFRVAKGSEAAFDLRSTPPTPSGKTERCLKHGQIKGFSGSALVGHATISLCISGILTLRGLRSVR